MTQKISSAQRAGKKLKNLIKESNRTQEKFADEFFVDAVTVRRWIAHGINKVDTLEEIAKFFDIDITELLK